MKDLERRCLDLLNLVLDQSRHRRKEVDDHGGYCRGTTSQILMGKIELKLRHILDILEVCEVEPRVFFRAVTADFDHSVAGLPPLEEQIREAARSYGLDPKTAIAEADRRLGTGTGTEIPIEDLVAMVSRHVALALEDKRVEEEKGRKASKRSATKRAPMARKAGK